MAELDGDRIELKDKLFDIYDNKWVEVIQIFSDRFLVRVPGRRVGGRSVSYDFHGRAARRAGRTLYWHDPRVVNPRKSAAQWQSQKDMVLNLMKDLSRVLPDVEAAVEPGPVVNLVESTPVSTREHALAAAIQQAKDAQGL